MRQADHSWRQSEHALDIKLKPLFIAIDAPDDLTGFRRVVEELANILILCRQIADEPSLPALEHLIELARFAQDNRSKIAERYPRMVGKTRKSMKNFYKDNAHYSLYWHRVTEPNHLPHYRAIVASTLAVRLRLEQLRRQDSQHDARNYLFNLYLRQLTEPADALEVSLLLELPVVAVTPAVLAAKLDELFIRHELTGKNKALQARFIYIRRVLHWFITDQWVGRKQHRFLSEPGIYSSRHHGGVDDSIDEERVPLNIEFPEGPTVRMSRFFERSREDAVLEEPVDQDLEHDDAPTATTLHLHPGRSVTYYHANRARLAFKNARYAAQAIELNNQRLFVTRSTLSGYELRVFLETLADTQLPAWKGVQANRRAEVRAWAALRFFLSRPADDLAGMRTLAGDDHPADNTLYLDRETLELHLPAPSPRHMYKESDREIALAVGQHWRLKLAPGISGLLHAPVVAGERLFRHSSEKHFQELLARINQLHATDLTPHRLTTYVANLISQLAPADEVMGLYFRGLPPNNHKPAVYSAVPSPRLQELFDAACAHISARSQPDDARQKQDRLAFPEGEAVHVGSRLVPRVEVLRALIREMLDTLQDSRARAASSLAETHNRYTTYVVFFLLATTGARPTAHLLPARFDLDLASGALFVSDKDSARYRNARVVWPHPRMLEQLEAYQAHVTRLRQHLAMTEPALIDQIEVGNAPERMSSALAPDRHADMLALMKGAPALFMLNDLATHIQPILPRHMVDYLGPHWERRVGTLRHFVRSQLLRSGVSGELINALLGHFDRGEGPWHMFSTLSPRAWRARIESAIDPIVDDLGLKVLPSPLMGAAA